MLEPNVFLVNRSCPSLSATCVYPYISHKYMQLQYAAPQAAPEDRSNFKDAVHATHNRHLLVKLRRLSQAARLPKVLQPEHGRATLTGASLELGSVNLLETLGQEQLTEQLQPQPNQP